MQDIEDYNLTAWYLNQRRIIELVSPLHVAEQLQTALASPAIASDPHLRTLFVQATLKDAVITWAKVAQPPTLGQLILSDSVTPGKVFTHFSNFYCRGLGAYESIPSSRRKPPELPKISSKLDSLLPGARLSIRYHPEHLTAQSAWQALSGQRLLFALAAVDVRQNNIIEAIPYVIGSMVINPENTSIKARRWGYRLEVFVDNIDSFELVRNELQPKITELSLLKDLPEKDVKQAFAEIIEEQNVPKDWGGEQSDLFSSLVVLDGQRISTAFAFKGPAKFRPMTMAELGQNGDQIHRLFSEPADLLVLQHCHEITPPVRAAMRAYATTIGNPRLFMLVNGYDTLRVLRAYGKCGFTPTTVTK